MTPEELEELRQWGCTREDVTKAFAEIDRLTAELTAALMQNVDLSDRIAMLEAGVRE